MLLRGHFSQITSVTPQALMSVSLLTEWLVNHISARYNQVSFLFSELLSEMQPHCYMNILLTGGCSLFPGMKERV